MSHTASSARKTPRKVSPKGDATVVYRGISIAPIAGKRSAVARAIRDALRAKSGEAGARPARA